MLLPLVKEGCYFSVKLNCQCIYLYLSDSSFPFSFFMFVHICIHSTLSTLLYLFMPYFFICAFGPFSLPLCFLLYLFIYIFLCVCISLFTYSCVCVYIALYVSLFLYVFFSLFVIRVEAQNFYCDADGFFSCL